MDKYNDFMGDFMDPDLYGSVPAGAGTAGQEPEIIAPEADPYDFLDEFRAEFSDGSAPVGGNYDPYEEPSAEASSGYGEVSDQEAPPRSPAESSDSDQAERRKQDKERRKRRAYDVHNGVLMIVFFAFVILFGIINLVSPDKEYSEAENRSLQQRPKFTLAALKDGSWFSQTTDWYADQFFARDGWISMKTNVDRLAGHKQEDDIFLGSDGYLQRAPYTPDEEADAKTISAINSFAQAYPDLNFTMMMVPDSATVQSQYLPKNAPVRDQLADIDAFTSQVDGSVNILDVAQVLGAHFQEYIYYKTDHHWTSMGAYYAYTAYAGAAGLTTNNEYDIYTVSDSFEGTLASDAGYHKSQDVITIYAPIEDTVSYYVYNPTAGTNTTSVYVSEKLDEKDQYTVFFGGNYGMLQINTTANTGRRLLIFKDSYANCFVPFLIPYFDEIVMIDSRYYYDNLSTLMTSEGITDVLFLYSADMLLTDTVLAGVLETGLPQTADTASDEPAAEADAAQSADDETADGETADDAEDDPNAADDAETDAGTDEEDTETDTENETEDTENTDSAADSDTEESVG